MSKTRTHQPLSELESETVAIFVRIVQALGLPRSVGQIYGLIYISPHPVCMDELVSRLGISLGSASQGLRQLRTL
ncbi:MAG: GbsR/MarR family transcriptional regulator, partial [Puniceicoccales bacterium]